ncbi:ATP-binding protein [Streptomyces sp. NPDC006458]|uniref:ATP-binding protein n=1 Tax=Streptomyces sp. NPDC006458 TaxID=3154302 RepID=UPI0033ABF233
MGADSRSGCRDDQSCPVLAEATIALSGDGPCIAEARHWAAAFLVDEAVAGRVTMPERVVSLAQLIVSEFVTNACKYAPGPILLRLCVTAGALEVEVWDSHPVLPVAGHADPHRVGGHGLEIVKAVAADLAVVPEVVGKRVTARILLDSHATPDARSSGPSTSGRARQDR